MIILPMLVIEVNPWEAYKHTHTNLPTHSEFSQQREKNAHKSKWHSQRDQSFIASDMSEISLLSSWRQQMFGMSTS